MKELLICLFYISVYSEKWGDRYSIDGREHSEQKLKIKERSVREDEEIINIMKSEVLRVEQREER